MDIGRFAWYDENSGGVAHPVRQKAPNRYGLYDVFGNASEWTLDRYYARTWLGVRERTSRPFSSVCTAARSGGTRHLPEYMPEYNSMVEDGADLVASAVCVLRGGSFNYSTMALGSAVRTSEYPWVRGSQVGFRCARSARPG